MSFWLTVAGMVAVTFGSRYAGVALRTDLPDYWVRFLHFVPIAVFASLVTPYLEGGRNEWGIRPPPRQWPRSQRGGRVSCGSQSSSGWASSGCYASRSDPPESQRRRSRPMAANSAAPSTPPSRSANDRSNPPARKIHASASGSRSAGIAPSA